MDKLAISETEKGKLLVYRQVNKELIGEIFFDLDTISDVSEKGEGEYHILNKEVSICPNSWSEVFVNDYMIPKDVDLVYIQYKKDE